MVRFEYGTGDACGQNMVTTATWSACKWALEQIKRDLPDISVNNFHIESTFSGDKQTSATLLVLPRGVHVQAEAWIPETVLKSTLKVLWILLYIVFSARLAFHFQHSTG